MQSNHITSHQTITHSFALRCFSEIHTLHTSPTNQRPPPSSASNQLTGITTVDRGECIAWRSEGGLDNEGSVTFTPHNDMTSVKLAIRFNVPRFVAALFSTAFIGRFVDGTLAQDLERFRNVSLRNVRERTAMGKSPPTSAAPSVERAISVLQEEKEKNSTQAGDR